MNLLDPDGRKLRITGEQKDETLKLLSKLYGGELNFEEDFVTITVEPEKYNKKSKLIAEIINSENIIVELWTTNGKFTQNKKLFCGGAFMGNETKYFDGQKQVHTYQNININVLQKVDEYEKYQGKSLMHELSESYLGGKYAYVHNINKVEPAYISSENDVYKYAHEEAIQTSRVWQIWLDKDNKEVYDISLCRKVIWIVDYNNRADPVQTYP